VDRKKAEGIVEAVKGEGNGMYVTAHEFEK
jgi:hypothetical protein